MCHSGVGLTPTVEGRVHHFSAGGLYDGLVLLIDDETRTYWDHITGRARYGPNRGATLETWPLAYTTVAAQRETGRPLRVAVPPRRGVSAWMFGRLGRKNVGTRGRLPPGFRATMGPPDPRRPGMDQGLGVVHGDAARFYPTSEVAGAEGQAVEDDWQGATLRVALGAVDRVPAATWRDGSRPMQMFTRWYGFSASFPGCGVFRRSSPQG